MEFYNKNGKNQLFRRKNSIMSTYFNGFTELPKSTKEQRNWLKDEANKREQALIKLKESIVYGETRVVLTNTIGHTPSHKWPMQGTEFECAGTITTTDRNTYGNPCANPRYYIVKWDNGHIGSYIYSTITIVKDDSTKLPKDPNKAFRTKKHIDNIKNNIDKAAKELHASLRKSKGY